MNTRKLACISLVPSVPQAYQFICAFFRAWGEAGEGLSPTYRNFVESSWLLVIFSSCTSKISKNLEVVERWKFLLMLVVQCIPYFWSIFVCFVVSSSSSVLKLFQLPLLTVIICLLNISERSISSADESKMVTGGEGVGMGRGGTHTEEFPPTTLRLRPIYGLRNRSNFWNRCVSLFLFTAV